MVRSLSEVEMVDVKSKTLPLLLKKFDGQTWHYDVSY